MALSTLFGCDDSDKVVEQPMCPGNYFKEVELDDTTPLGFSAASVLSKIQGTHTSVLTWLPSIDGYGRAGRSTTITVEVEPQGTAQASEHCNREEVLIDAVLHVSTSDGALDQRLAAKLVAVDDDSAWATLALDDGALAGSFEPPSEPTPEGHAAFELVVSLSAAGSGGMLTSGYPVRDSLALWTASEPCTKSAATSAAALGFADSFVAIMPWQGTYPLEYADGAPTSDLEYALELTDGCSVAPRANRFYSTQYSAQLKVRSSDGRVDGTWPVDVTHWADNSFDSEVIPSSWTFGTYDGTADPQQFASLLQDFGVAESIDTEGYDTLTVEASGHVSRFEPGRRFLRVDGLKGGVCTQQANGRSLCEGSEVTPLFRAQF